MKKIYLLLFFAAVFAMNINAQVAIGTIDPPTKGAVLELTSDTLGFLPTRVELTNLTTFSPIVGSPVEGMVVFNTKVAPNDGIVPGLYCFTGGKWTYLTVASTTKENWFYMPSIVLDVDEEKQYTVELYDLYAEQLNSASTNLLNGKGEVVPSSPGAPAKVLAKIPAADKLYYYVTDYDTNVFTNVSIDANGQLKYTVKGPADDKTFMNIVFVEQ